MTQIHQRTAEICNALALGLEKGVMAGKLSHMYGSADYNDAIQYYRKAYRHLDKGLYQSSAEEDNAVFAHIDSVAQIIASRPTGATAAAEILEIALTRIKEIATDNIETLGVDGLLDIALLETALAALQQA